MGGIDAAWLCGLNGEQAERMRKTEVKPGDVNVQQGQGRVMKISIRVSHRCFLTPMCMGAQVTMKKKLKIDKKKCSLFAYIMYNVRSRQPHSTLT